MKLEDLPSEEQTEVRHVVESLDSALAPEKFLLFFGYPRSGSSLFGSIIDANDEAIIANEYDVFNRWQSQHLTREPMFRGLVENAGICAAAGRKQAGYDYSIHAGGLRALASKSVRVLGDKKAGATTLWAHILGREEVRALQEAVGAPLQVVHVRRNHYNIMVSHFLARSEEGGAAQQQWNKAHDAASHEELSAHPLDTTELGLAGHLNSTAMYILNLMRYNAQAAVWAKEEQWGWHDTSLELLQRDPRKEVEALCSTLHLDCAEAYVQATTAIVRRAEHASRDEIVWPKAVVEMVEASVAQLAKELPSAAFWLDYEKPKHVH